MKLIEAVIQKLKLQEVRNALEGLGVDEFMETPVLCHGSNTRQEMVFRGAKFVAYVAEKVKLEIISADDSVGKIIEAIGSIARTEHHKDCRIAIRPYLEVT